MSADPLQAAYKFDVFVSYATHDDVALEPLGRGWVDSFVTRLTQTLGMRLGRDVRVWFERLALQSDTSLSEAREVVLRDSALFLPILSPSYLASRHCMQELAAFKGYADHERIVKVVRLPATQPLPLPDVVGFNFFDRDTQEDLLDRRYFAELDRLAVQVSVLLKSFEKAEVSVAAHRKNMEVFLCHSSGDKPAVRNLRRRLKEDGFAPWLDEEELLPGHNWDSEIRNAINRAGAVIVCLSRSAVNKEGYVQREIKLVLDKATEMPEQVIFLIPARLEECTVPSRLSHLHWVNLFEQSGYSRLLQALRIRANALLEGPKHEKAGLDNNFLNGAGDPMFDEAVRLVFAFGKASTSLLQRRLRIGYGRAAHLIELMERDGLVGHAEGSKPRELLKQPDYSAEVDDLKR